jgi:hypothetical protein
MRRKWPQEIDIDPLLRSRPMRYGASWPNREFALPGSGTPRRPPKPHAARMSLYGQSGMVTCHWLKIRFEKS